MRAIEQSQRLTESSSKSALKRHPASDTRRGRLDHWSRDDLLKAVSQFSGILEREAQGRVLLSSFTGQYLPVLLLPADVVNELELGDINLQ